MRDRPHPSHKLEWPGGVVPEWARPKQNPNKRFGKGRGGKGHERQGGSSPGKRERLQKVMAQSGHGSRRNIEILIAQGHITINGQVAKLGDSVGPGDKVKLDGHLITLRFGDPLPRVLLYHKPDNEIVTRDDPEKRATVFDKLPKVHGGRWVSVGRLDLNTSGLLMFTTSGELAQRLTHPRFEVEREYAVRVMGELTEEQRKQLLETGVRIEDDICKFDSIEDRGGEGSNHWYHVVLREGKNREVRKMMEAVGLMVSRLMRVRFGSVELPGHIKRGMFREMEEEQVQELLNFAGMNEPPPKEEGAAEEEEDPDENIGNRIDHAREARMKPRELDDDIGNRFTHHPAAAQRAEPDGNRGTYGEGPAPRGPKGAGGPRRPHGQGKPFGFKKRGAGQSQGRGDDRGNVAVGHSQPLREADGNRGNGQGQPHGQGQPQGQGQPHGQGQGHRKRGQHKPHGQQPQGAAQNAGQPHGPRPPGQPPAAGAGKPGRGRRNKNRNRNRGGQAQPAGEGGAPVTNPTE
jgi:23S rRNA pseudouridine2605 synthase